MSCHRTWVWLYHLNTWIYAYTQLGSKFKGSSQKQWVQGSVERDLGLGVSSREAFPPLPYPSPQQPPNTEARREGRVEKK